MTIRQITDRYHVSPQISAEDIPALKEAGVTLVICNRPDEEVPPSHQADAIGAAVRAAGIAFENLPLTHQTMTPDNIARQADLVAGASGAVLAYCASGTRCSVVWALGQARELSVDDILTSTARAGYDLGGLRPTLEALARR